jgi:aryl-alcohol dehydrogenase-like predicted oxidoreductase
MEALSAQDIGPVVLGTMTFGAQVDRDEAARMVLMARHAGVRCFDTSNNYNGGRAEEILGRALGPDRGEVLLSTKVGSAVDQADRASVGLTRQAICTAVEASLRRLGTDNIDIYYFHRPDWDTPIEESLAAAADLVAAGKVRFLGQSNFAAWQVAEMRYLAEMSSWPAVGVSQIMYNLLARRVEVEYAACSRRFGQVDIGYNPLAGGLLTGKHRPDRQPPEGTRFSKERYRDRYWNTAQFAAVDKLRGVAGEAGLTLVQLALRWLRDRPLTDSILLGASSVAQLRDNLDALDGPGLDAGTLDACDAVWDELGGTAPHYNR